MPRLSNQQLTNLNNIVPNNTATPVHTIQLPNHDKDEVACWKWALFGLQNQIQYNNANTSTNIHRPGEAFSAILLGTAIDPNSIWHTELAAIQVEHQKVVNFNPDATTHNAADWVNWRNWRLQIMQAACNKICTSLGFIVANQATDYTLVMHFDDAPPIGGNPYGPNETHWWIEIPLHNNSFVCIETFPQQANPPTLQFRFNSRYSNNNNIRVPINNLLQAHINLLP